MLELQYASEKIKKAAIALTVLTLVATLAAYLLLWHLGNADNSYLIDAVLLRGVFLAGAVVFILPSLTLLYENELRRQNGIRVYLCPAKFGMVPLESYLATTLVLLLMLGIGCWMLFLKFAL